MGQCCGFVKITNTIDKDDNSSLKQRLSMEIEAHLDKLQRDRICEAQETSSQGDSMSFLQPGERAFTISRTDGRQTAAANSQKSNEGTKIPLVSKDQPKEQLGQAANASMSIEDIQIESLTPQTTLYLKQPISFYEGSDMNSKESQPTISNNDEQRKVKGFSNFSEKSFSAKDSFYQSSYSTSLRGVLSNSLRDVDNPNSGSKSKLDESDRQLKRARKVKITAQQAVEHSWTDLQGAVVQPRCHLRGVLKKRSSYYSDSGQEHSPSNRSSEKTKYKVKFKESSQRKAAKKDRYN